MPSLYKPSAQTTTVYGMITGMAASLGLPYNPSSYQDHTLNAKLGVLQAQLPLDVPRIRYFGIGVKGTTTLSESTPHLVQPYKPQAGNKDLHQRIPFRVTIGDPLSAEEAANYRMHTTTTENGVTRHFYWLKKIDFSSSGTGIAVNSVTGNVSSPYGWTDTSGSPLLPGDLQGKTTERLIVTAKGKLVITHDELASVIDNYLGNSAYYRISELGLFTGEEYSLGSDYYEAVGCHLAMHRCMYGFDLSQDGAVHQEFISFENSSAFILS